MLAGLHSYSWAVFLGAVGIFSPKALTGNFRLAKLCLEDASRALVFPPKMGQVLALPTYLPQRIAMRSRGDIYTRYLGQGRGSSPPFSDKAMEIL